MAVGGRQPLDLLRRHPEAGVDHPERLEHQLAQMLLQSPAAEAGEEDPEDAERVVVAEALARLMRERQAGQSREPLRGVEIRWIGARLDAHLAHRDSERAVAEEDPVAGGVRQQIAHGDRPIRRDRVVDGRV